MWKSFCIHLNNLNAQNDYKQITKYFLLLFYWNKQRREKRKSICLVRVKFDKIFIESEKNA